jgi:hypothetical protein
MREGSPMYRWLQMGTWRWRGAEPADDSRELTRRQIRFWAAMALLTGILMVLAGAVGLAELVLYTV